MCKRPAVSIVVPVYNAEKYLPQTMRSICGQTLRDVEIICVDDCSTDKSPEILRDFASEDPRIRIVTHRQKIWARRWPGNAGWAKAAANFLYSSTATICFIRIVPGAHWN